MSDDFEEYEEFADIYKKIYRISSDLNVFLQFFTVVINIFHFIVLFRKELRNGAIYILMIGICIADILNFFCDFYNVGCERNWFEIPFYHNDYCMKTFYFNINPIVEPINIIIRSTRPVAVWLAILMAIIRTLSVMFPMSNFIQKFTKSKTVIYMVTVVFIFWFVFYSWHLVFLQIHWYLDILDRSCIYYKQDLNETRYIFTIPRTIFDYMETQDALEYLVRIVPTILYPILTFILILELRTIKKKRQNVNKNSLNDRSDNTTKLILLMTISFMLSEGLAGLNTLIIQKLTYIDGFNEEFSDLIMVLGTVQFIWMNIRTLNAMSHAFICFAMSSQYREAVKSFFCSTKKSNGNLILVSSISSVNSQSTTERSKVKTI